MGLDRVANSPPESKINWPQRFCEINHWWKCQAKNKDGVEKKETKRIVSIWHWFQDAHFFTFWHLWTLWNWHISYAILQPLACRHQRDLAVTACMCKLAHRHCSCQHFSGIVCVVGSTCARFNCRVKCLQKDYTMIQYWKENLQCLQKGRKTKQQGINLILVNWIFIRREMIVIHSLLWKTQKPKCCTPAARCGPWTNSITWEIVRDA